MISAGKMRLTITIERPTGTPGSLGQVQWEEFAVTRAELRGLSGRAAGHELSSPQLGGSVVNFVFVLRYLPGVKGNMRVRTGSRVFKVEFPSVGTEGNARTTEIYCREVLSV